jgi:hypothetical protein
MAEEAQSNVTELADQLVEGFVALSGEYQVLFDQQKQLESKLSWAKQQVRDDFSRLSPPMMNIFSSRPAAAFAALTENTYIMTLTRTNPISLQHATCFTRTADDN